jgi:eukaryotic-like serine/threonine-protein kinase
MGDIYRATDSALGRAVAVKVLAERYAEDEAVRERFTREALAAARLSGEPNIVTIFDVGEWNDQPFIVMEYLAGGSLEDVLRESGPQEPGPALDWLEQAARALDAAHRNGVVHRDVKPANLLLDRAGEVHVADFGIAHAAGLDSMTVTGMVLGTAGYLAPEQAEGHSTTPATDRYALAVVAYELLTAHRPFERESPTAEAAAHVQAPVPSVCDRLDRLPCELDPVFTRGLAKDPDERPASCIELVNDLRRAFADAAGATQAIPVVVAEASPAISRSRRRWPLVVAALAAAGLGGVGLAALLADGDDVTAPTTTPPPSTLVTTVVTTLPGTTKQVTVTAAPPTQPSRPTEPDEDDGDGDGGGGSISEGVALTDQATRLMRAGSYGGALPVAQRALRILQGSGHTYEGYANFNVGKSLAELGRCEEALPYLERREQLLGSHPDVTSAKRQCGA